MRRLGLCVAAAGAAIWVVGVAAWTLGVWVTMPPAVVRALVLGLAATVGGVLLIVGSRMARAASGRAEGARDAETSALPVGTHSDTSLRPQRVRTPAESRVRATE
jgi:type VI protein secretion system component VasK